MLVFHANIAGQGSVNTDSGGFKGKRARGLGTEAPRPPVRKGVTALPLPLSDCMTLGPLASQSSQDDEGSLKSLCFILKYLGIK